MSSAGAARSKKAPTKSPTTPLSSHGILYGAIESFIRSNQQRGSSIPVNAALEEIGACIDLQSVFPIPLKHCLFGVDTSFMWMLFLTLAPVRAIEKDEILFPDVPDSAPFSPLIALELITNVYDLEIQDQIWEHFEESDDDDDEDSDGEDDAEAAPAAENVDDDGDDNDKKKGKGKKH